MKRKFLPIVFLILLLCAKCNVPIDIRNPDNAVDTLTKISRVRNDDLFYMIIDKDHYNPDLETVNEIFNLMNENYVNVLSKNFTYDEKLGNVNDVRVKLTSRKSGQVSYMNIRFRDIEDLWYVADLDKE